MRINFEHEFNEESFAVFLDEIALAEEKKDELGFTEPIEFWISSPGGETHYAFAMLDILESLPVEIIAYGDLSSSAFILFTLFKGKKRILPYVQPMIHQGAYALSIRADGYHSEYDKDLKKYRISKEKEFFKKMSVIWLLTKKQKQSYLKGRDVFIPNEQLQQIIDEQSKASTQEPDQVPNSTKRRTKGSQTSD